MSTEAPMDPQELFDIFASGRAYFEGNLDKQTFQTQRQSTGKTSPVAHYLFTVGAPGNEWDVIELDNAVTVKMFGGDELNHLLLKIPGKPETSPIKPVLRYVLMTPVEESEEALKMMGQPHIDRYVMVAVLLADADQYTVVGAEWTGRRPTEADKNKIEQIFPVLTFELDQDLNRSRITPAPDIGPDALSLIEHFKRNRLDNTQERRELTEALMRLPDASFMEALGRILPWAWHQNEWIATEPVLAERAYELRQRMPKKDHNNIRKAPWKTAWLLPAPFQPKITYRHSKWEREAAEIHNIR